jgi:hypothetical protein
MMDKLFLNIEYEHNHLTVQVLAKRTYTDRWHCKNHFFIFKAAENM